MSAREASTVRIIGGAWRSRRIRFPAIPGLRPTADRVRETLFNWLGQDMTGLVCLDLFAGSGALGFEAASRGAAGVTLVERDRAAFEALQANAARLGAEVRIERADALEFLRRDSRRYDVIFVDPPFDMRLPGDLFDRLDVRLAPAGRIYLESNTLRPLPAGWRTVRQGRAGAVHFRLVERDGGSASQPGASREAA